MKAVAAPSRAAKFSSLAAYLIAASMRQSMGTTVSTASMRRSVDGMDGFIRLQSVPDGPPTPQSRRAISTFSCDIARPVSRSGRGLADNVAHLADQRLDDAR